MESPEDELAAALRELRAEYLADSTQRLGELWSALKRVQNGDADALPSLRVLVHRLAGSGGGYGLPEVSTTARAADDRCRSLIDGGVPPTAADVNQLRVLIQGVADAFARAKATE